MMSLPDTNAFNVVTLSLRATKGSVAISQVLPVSRRDCGACPEPRAFEYLSPGIASADFIGLAMTGEGSHSLQ